MITVPTVLVLGAGASNACGFPLGRGLRDLVCKTSSIGGPDVTRTGPDPTLYLEFVDKLKKSAYGSVDSFLEAFPKYTEVGKRAMAWELIGLENESRLFPPEAPSAHWYEMLANELLADGPDRIANNRITIVTFNYDRSLEHYLACVIGTRTGLGYHQGVTSMCVLNILHVHGSLGRLLPGPGARPYDTQRSETAVRTATDSIQIIHEVKDNNLFTRARAAIEATQRLYFLGFGYHSKNMERLGILPGAPDRFNAVKLYVGASGMATSHCQQINARYGLKPHNLSTWDAALVFPELDWT